MKMNTTNNYFGKAFEQAIKDHITQDEKADDLNKVGYGFKRFEIMDIKKRKSVRTAWGFDMTVYDILVSHKKTENEANCTAFAVNVYDDGQMCVFYNGTANIGKNKDGDFCLMWIDISYGAFTDHMARCWLGDIVYRLNEEVE